MINPQWLELPMSGTILYGPKDVRAIEVWLYLFSWKYMKSGLSAYKLQRSGSACAFMLPDQDFFMSSESQQKQVPSVCL